jgi:hypothetical protein
MKLSRLLTLLLVLACVAVDPVLAQEVRATISGRVTDPAGAVVPGASVVAISEDTNVSFEAKSNGQGIWTIQYLLPARYNVAVSAPGFKKTERLGIELQTADVKQIDVQLELGNASQTVEVTSEAPLLDTTSAVSGTVVSSKEILEMPTSSHVVSLLALMSPGVVQQDQDNNPLHMWSYVGGSSFTANGGRNNIWSNSFQLDGMANTKSGGYISFIPPQDSIQEFRVQTNAYDASISRQAGATINMQTRSGSKNYHGTFYYFKQPYQLGANSFQNNLSGAQVSPESISLYGGTFGGPVWIPKVYHGTQKTFFFVSVEPTNQAYPTNNSFTSVPTAAERNGDFSQSWTTLGSAGTLVKYPILIYDPMSVDTKGNRTMFPGQLIPKSRLDPIAQAMLGYLPLPNQSGDGTGNARNNYNPLSSTSNKVPVVSVRGDQNWNNSNHSFLTVRWSHLNQFSGDTFGMDSLLAGSHTQRIAKSVGLDHVITLSPSMILDVKYTLNRFEEPSNSLGAGFDPTKLGFPASYASHLQVPSFPYITISNYASFGTTQAGSYTNNTHHVWSGNLTHVHGNHVMRYGGEFWVLQQAQGGVGNQGEFDFNANWTRLNNNNNAGTGDGSALASYLLGLPTGGNLPINANSMYSQHFYGFFFQDDWRVSARLTVNLGLRWDYERPVEERFNRLSDRYNPTAINPISNSAQAAYAAILSNPANANNAGVQLALQYLSASAFQVPGVPGFAGQAGLPRTATNGDFHEWQPRIGFAYQIDNNTVIRGGFGRFTQAGFSAGGQTGFSTTASLNPTQDNYLTPYDTLANPFRAGIAQPTGNSLGALTNLGQGVGTWDNPDLGRLYSLEWSLHLQRQVKTWLFEIGYSHNKTYGIWNFGTWDQNLQNFALWQKLQTPTFSATGKPVATLDWNQTLPNPFYQLPGVSTNASIYTSKTISLNQLLRPNPIYGTIGENNPSGTNQYDAGLLKISRRFSGGFSVITAFTWSKLFEDTSFLGPQVAGPHVEHKLGGEDRPYIFSVAPIWQIPVGRNRKFGRTMPKALDYVAGGWELSGNFRIQSGKAVAFSGPAFFCGHNFSLPKSKQSLNQWFDTSCFYPFPNSNTPLATIQAYPAWTGIQNMPGYNYVPVAGDTIKNGVYQDFANFVQTYPSRWGSVRAPGVNNVDLGLRKNVKVNERVGVQLRLDAFNAFNHPRFGAPDANPSDAGFGKITPTQLNQPRGIELGVRVSY